MAPKDSLLSRLAPFRRDLSAFTLELIIDSMTHSRIYTLHFTPYSSQL
jgi:hypothetical protein